MRSYAREIGFGLAVGLGTVGLVLLLEGSQRTTFAALLLAVIGAVYFGFAVADGRTSAIAAQAASAGVFGAIAYAGAVEGSELLLGLGYAGHAGWDMLHHEGGGFTEVRRWYPPWCAVIDLTVAVPLLAGWV